MKGILILLDQRNELIVVIDMLKDANTGLCLASRLAILLALFGYTFQNAKVNLQKKIS
jgi:hypothetical protein